VIPFGGILGRVLWIICFCATLIRVLARVPVYRVLMISGISLSVVFFPSRALMCSGVRLDRLNICEIKGLCFGHPSNLFCKPSRGNLL